MQQMLANELGEALIPKASPLIQKLSDTIVVNIPDRMKYTIAVSILMHYASQFRRNAELLDGTSVPSNFCTVIAAGSGEGKDSSYSMMYKAFAKQFETIEAYNDKMLIEKAIAAATHAGEEMASAEEIYEQYLKPRIATETMFTTAPGVIELANSVMNMPIGAPLVKTSEMADEYQTNKDTEELIKMIATLYDLGNAPAKITKGADFRSKELKGVPLNAILMGSYYSFLEDDALRKKFVHSFTSKLARRSFFVFFKERIEEPYFSTAKELLAYEKALSVKAKVARDSLHGKLTELTEYGLQTIENPIKISDEVDEMFTLYKRYNKEIANIDPNPSSLDSLVRMHNQWRALKLATVLAFTDKSDVIFKKHYTQAIQFVELLASDMKAFDSEIHKAAHERFSDYIRTLVQSDGKAVINVHDIKKNNYISTVSHAKLQELIHLCTGYDTSGIYSIINDGGAIQYETIIKTEVIGISFKPISTVALNRAVASGNYDDIRTAKHDISVTTAYGFEVADTTFADLGNLLESDYAYSPFKFRNGTRSKDNIIGGSKWVVLDIDSSPITASEAHFMLSDINHHIALSSDPNNEYKFRVLIELDCSVELSALAWKHFYLGIAEDLALKVDPLPQSQIFFSYADRPILSTLDAYPLEARPYIVRAKELEATKEHKASVVTPAHKKALLADPTTTFSYAFEAPNGTGSRSIIRAMYHLRELGGSVSEALELFDEIQDYWEVPFDHSRATLMRDQITRMF